MILETIPVGMLGCNCTVFGDETTGEAIVVDPGDDIAHIQEIIERNSLKVGMIVITHAHIDHIGGAHKLRELTGAPVYMHEADKMLSDMLDVQATWLGVEPPPDPGIDTPAKEGDLLHAGAVEAQVIHTPGHTPGSISLFIASEKTLLAGDTLFHGSVGRTDLPGGNSAQIKQSISGKLYTLPEETIVIAGHGGTTTIGREKRLNAFVRG